MKLKYSRLSNKMDAASVHFRRTMENKIYTMYSRNLTDDTFRVFYNFPMREMNRSEVTKISTQT